MHGAFARAVANDVVHPVPQRPLDDRRVFAGIGDPLVDGFAEINAVVQNLVDVALVDRLAAFRPHSLRSERQDQLGRRPDAQEPLEDHSDGLRFGVVDDELAVLDVVAERRPAAHPHALLAGGGELVADALADHLPLELREGEQDVQGQPAHGRRRVERLRDGDEGDAVAIEDLDELGEVHERAAQAVDLVDDDHVDPLRLDVGDQALQRRPLQGAARETAVVVVVGHEQPALRLLARDIGLARLALGVEAVELLSRPSSLDLRV